MPSLASLPAEVLGLIFTYLQCFADPTSVAGVCKDWRKAVHMRLRDPQQPRYRQLPWLLQPSYDALPSTLTSYVSGATDRRIRLPEGLRDTDDFCGSHEGGWVAVSAHRGCHGLCFALVNLINQAAGASSIVPLPRYTLRSSHPTRLLEMTEISMVTLSGVPTAAEGCIGAAHPYAGYPSDIFCRLHVDRHWVPPVLDTEPLQDILYHRGEIYQGFYAISKTENLYVFLPTTANNNHGEVLVMRQVVVLSSSRALQATGRGRVGGSIITRYLVESRGKLLLVLRYSGMDMERTADMRTLHFRVFKMEIDPLSNGGGHSAAWTELDGLDGRVITLATGCSRAFEPGQYRGFQGGSIYYLDDAVGADKSYPIFSFTDVGMYSMGETKIVSEIDHVPNDEASSSTSAAGGAQQVVVHETVASVWPLLCKPGNRRPVWFLPPSAEEWLLPQPAAPADSVCRRYV